MTLAELKALAEAAMPDEWYKPGDNIYLHGKLDNSEVRYIAVARPEIVLAMIAFIQAFDIEISELSRPRQTMNTFHAMVGARKALDATLKGVALAALDTPEGHGGEP